MPHPTSRFPGPLLVAAAMLGGCGITNPYQQTRPAAQTQNSGTSAVSTAAPANDPSDPAPSGPDPANTSAPSAQAAQSQLAVNAASATPQAALKRYVVLYSNWTSSKIGVVQAHLAQISLGQARAQAQQAAASYSRDTILQHSNVTNHGAVVSIAPGRGPAHGRWVIVTSEHTDGQGDYSGLPPNLHVIYAHLAHNAKGWIVDQWLPQN
jgi:hypothetical protein